MAEGGPLSGLEHGGRVAAARRRFPDAPQPFVDLSTGINPVSYPLPPLPPEIFARLPDPADLARLQAVAAEAYGAPDPAMVVVAPGTQAVISALPFVCPVRRVSVLSPTYGEHAACWAASGAVVREVAGLEALTDAEVAVVCNPNNPDGRCRPAEALLAVARKVRLLVVDEAFIDFEADIGSCAPLLSETSRMVVLRSFGKCYGLAGLRLGFAIAGRSLALRLRQALGPWAVSGPALALGPAALRDRAWRQASIARCHEDAARLDALLTEAGLRVLGGTRLFRLAEATEAPEWGERLGRAGILVRSYARAPGWLRFGLPGKEAEWDRLHAVLRG